MVQRKGQKKAARKKKGEVALDDAWRTIAGACVDAAAKEEGLDIDDGDRGDAIEDLIARCGDGVMTLLEDNAAITLNDMADAGDDDDDEDGDD